MDVSKLQSEEQRDLLDIIDQLRSTGLGSYVDLPEIIVCGDQSAGKSSDGVKISIAPAEDRTDEDKARLREFCASIDLANPDISPVVKLASEAMEISDTKRFANDILRIELSGPKQPHLTMVDLPGIFRAGNTAQSKEEGAIVTEMVRRHMKRERSIILVVLSAKVEMPLQEVTELAKELDPKGVRTMGLITKPDTLDAGSENEAAYIKLAQNLDAFFSSPSTVEGFGKRLRAVVRNMLGEYSDEMRLRGRKWIILESVPAEKELKSSEIARSDYLDKVKGLMTRSKGRELPGLFDPMIVGELFKDQSSAWSEISIRFKDKIFEQVGACVHAILAYVAVGDTAGGILQLMEARLGTIKEKLDDKVGELLRPHMEGHPTTENHYLTDTVQKSQNDRRRVEIETALKLGFGERNLPDKSLSVNPLTLLNSLSQIIEPDMERNAAGLATDYMEAYYKVARKRLVDDFTALAIEQTCIDKLDDLHTSYVVVELSDEEVMRLAGEKEESLQDRERCSHELNILQSGLRRLRKLDRRWLSGHGQESSSITENTHQSPQAAISDSRSPSDDSEASQDESTSSVSE